MARIEKLFTVASLAMMLAGCGGSPADAPAETPATPVQPATAAATTAVTPVASGPARPTVFMQCAACHATEPGKHGVGPSLAGVYGTKSAEVKGYAFSDAMKSANLTWDDTTLDRYLTAPMKVVPGTKMTFAGVSDAAKRQELIAYLKAIK